MDVRIDDAGEEPPSARVNRIDVSLRGRIDADPDDIVRYLGQEWRRGRGTVDDPIRPPVGVRMGLRYVKNLGEKEVTRVEAARILGDDYDVEVLEAHHRFKVDAPSGTALRLAERAAAGLDRNLSEVAVHGRQGVVGERTRTEIGMHALRLGDLPGDHSVFYGAPGECLELRHHATSRDAFALGALRAVRFAARAEPGLYDMGDVLNLK